jgi:hypothetical protein
MERLRKPAFETLMGMQGEFTRIISGNEDLCYPEKPPK